MDVVKALWFKWKFIMFVFSLSVQYPGPFTFTYNRGHGECKNPVSNIESCTEDSRLLLNLQACPDVAGTESTGNLPTHRPIQSNKHLCFQSKRIDLKEKKRYFCIY